MAPGRDSGGRGGGVCVCVGCDGMNRMNGLMIIRLPRRPRFAAHNYGAALQMLADNGYSKSKGQSAVCELLHNCGKLPPAFERQTRISEATLTLIVLLRNGQTQFYFAFLIVTPPPATSFADRSMFVLRNLFRDRFLTNCTAFPSISILSSTHIRTHTHTHKIPP